MMAIHLPISAITPPATSIIRPDTSIIQLSWSKTASCGLPRLMFMYAARIMPAYRCTTPTPMQTIITGMGSLMGSRMLFTGRLKPNQVL